MDILIQIVLLVLGFAMLIKGADWFVGGASGIAGRLGIPQIVIGLTIVAFGTSAPEAAVSITAALKDNAGITIGNIVGSNILNILLILGLTAVIAPLAVKKNTLRFEMPFLIGVSIVLLVTGLLGNIISLNDGIVMWLFFIAFFVYLIQVSKSERRNLTPEQKEAEDAKPKGKLWLMILLTCAGLALVILGSDLTVNSATYIAKTFGMSDRLIGLTIVAFGTSLPELVTSIIAARKKMSDIAIGNIVGSNIFNILFVVGTTALITPVAFSQDFVIDTCIAVGTSILLFLFCLRKQKLTRPGGVILLLCFAAYFTYLVIGK